MAKRSSELPTLGALFLLLTALVLFAGQVRAQSGAASSITVLSGTSTAPSTTTAGTASNPSTSAAAGGSTATGASPPPDATSPSTPSPSLSLVPSASGFKYLGCYNETTGDAAAGNVRALSEKGNMVR